MTAAYSLSRGRLELAMADSRLEARVDGVVVAAATDATVKAGNVAIGTGWHGSSWDDFSVTAPV